MASYIKYFKIKDFNRDANSLTFYSGGDYKVNLDKVGDEVSYTFLNSDKRENPTYTVIDKEQHPEIADIYKMCKGSMKRYALTSTSTYTEYPILFSSELSAKLFNVFKVEFTTSAAYAAYTYASIPSEYTVLDQTAYSEAQITLALIEYALQSSIPTYVLPKLDSEVKIAKEADATAAGVDNYKAVKSIVRRGADDYLITVKASALTAYTKDESSLEWLGVLIDTKKKTIVGLTHDDVAYTSTDVTAATAAGAVSHGEALVWIGLTSGAGTKEVVLKTADESETVTVSFTVEAIHEAA